MTLTPDLAAIEAAHLERDRAADPTGPGPSAAATYDEHADRFGEVVALLDAASWDRPSACAGWTGRDVVRHVVESQRAFVERVGLTVPAVDLDQAPDAGWHGHRAAVGALLADDAVASSAYQSHFGPSTVGDMLASFYGFDMVVHRWDLAQAGGIATEFTDGELDLLERSVDAFGDNLYSDGVCAAAVPVPADASRQDRILAVMGRDPNRQA